MIRDAAVRHQGNCSRSGNHKIKYMALKMGRLHAIQQLQYEARHLSSQALQVKCQIRQEKYQQISYLQPMEMDGKQRSPDSFGVNNCGVYTLETPHDSRAAA